MQRLFVSCSDCASLLAPWIFKVSDPCATFLCNRRIFQLAVPFYLREVGGVLHVPVQ